LSRIRRIVGLGGSPAARLALRRCAAGKNIRHAVGSLLRQSLFGWLADTRMPTAPNAFAMIRRCVGDCRSVGTSRLFGFVRAARRAQSTQDLRPETEPPIFRHLGENCVEWWGRPHVHA